MNRYPEVLSEDETLDLVLSGKSLSRFGDGELKLCLGDNCVSQKYDIKLASELKAILYSNRDNLCVAIPNIISNSPKNMFWASYLRPKYFDLMDSSGGFTYGSSFITRPDSAPWIDNPEYWEKIQKIWKGKNVTLVHGGNNALLASDLKGACVTEILCPERDAYDSIDDLIEKIKNAGNKVVVLCCGATATVLASFLSTVNCHAIDLGHIGMFINNQGIYKTNLDHLISTDYIKQNTELHARPEGYGGGGYKLEPIIRKFAKEMGCRSILDYGCGQGTLKKELKKQGWKHYIGEYDPAIYSKHILPKPANLVVCSDVLEHVESEKLNEVIDHIFRLTKKAAFLYIALRPANKTLPDGRNSHLIIKSMDWWLDLIKKHPWKVSKFEVRAEHSIKIWLKK